VVALVTSILVSALMSWGVFWYAKRREVGKPATWGEAMVGSTYVFFLAFLVYGIVPHQWLSLAENEFNWRADRIVHGPGGILKPMSAGGWLPLDITYRTVSDSIAAVLYIVFLVLQIVMWISWQNRGKAQSADKVVATSSFGRPLVKQG